jgi:hypothetical protein
VLDTFTTKRIKYNMYNIYRPLPNLEGQVPVFISPRNRVAQLYPRALGSLFVFSYDSQGYGGGILNRLHTGQLKIKFLPSNYLNIQSVPHRKYVASPLRRPTS